MTTPKVEKHFFITHLEKLVKEQDIGTLVNLRRGLGKPPGTAREMDHFVLRYVPYVANEAQENAYYLIASLFAYWYLGKDSVNQNPPKNMGASLLALMYSETAGNNNRDEVEKRVEKRLVALLNCYYDDLPKHLHHNIGLLKSKDIPVDWSQLLHDVQNWQSENRDVQRSWARGFWTNFQDFTNSDLKENKKLVEA